MKINLLLYKIRLQQKPAFILSFLSTVINEVTCAGHNCFFRSKDNKRMTGSWLSSNSSDGAMLFKMQEVPKEREAKRANWAMLNEAACCFLGIFLTRKVPGSLLKVSRESTKQRKGSQSRKIIWKTLFLLKDRFEWLNLNEIEHPKRTPKTLKFICSYSVLVPNHLCSLSPSSGSLLTVSSPCSRPCHKTALGAHSTLKYRQLASLRHRTNPRDMIKNAQRGKFRSVK